MLFSAKGLIKDFTIRRPGRPFGVQKQRALGGISLTMSKNEIVGLVGESGSGKTTLARVLLGIERQTAGQITFSSDLARGHRDIQMIFQNPEQSLDPRMTMEDSLKEPLRIQSAPCSATRLRTALEAVHLSESLKRRYPYQLSGGQLQRLVIARALITEPKVLICDEPTSSLDVSLQAQILKLLVELKDTLGIALMYITHNLSIVRIISDRILVISSGIIVESGIPDEIYQNPKDDRTKELIGLASTVFYQKEKE